MPCFVRVFFDKNMFYPGLFSFLLKLTMQWDTRKCRTNSVYKPFCDQVCKWIMVLQIKYFCYFGKGKYILSHVSVPRSITPPHGLDDLPSGT